MNKRSALALVLSAFSPFALANIYVGGSLSAMDYSEGSIEDVAPVALSGLVGIKANEHFSTEVRVGFGVGNDSAKYQGESVTLDVDNFVGVYGRLGMPVGKVYPYVVAGLTQVEMTIDVAGQSMSETDSDISYGVGLDYNLNKSLKLNLEYINLYDRGDSKINSVNIGATYHF
ncbi:porin family protein [Endozoicomonas atrinae]|uniref:porin family protein n=1 Tax=Endozoicomonas atrinae TaxID=1333660 RepID=UPI0008271A2E|nr:porin family protein [Endozoicomonas atrinae]